MLTKLTVSNYALIESLCLELDSRLNIITGQTGAGKSILLGALGLILGNRADVAALSDSGKNCVVEGVFDIDGYGLEAFFGENDLDYSREITVRRVITPAGKSRAYVNDLPVQLTVLKELGGRLIDIHSQHQSLLVSEAGFRMKMVDGIASDAREREAYGEAYSALRAAEHELSALRDEVEQSRRDEEYVRFQYEQLAAVKLRKGELEELEAEQKELANVERIKEALGMSAESLDADERGILVTLKSMCSALAHVADVWQPAAELASRVESAEIELKDISAGLADALERMDADPQRLVEVESRLDTLYSLLQKHRVTSVDDLMAIEAEFGSRLQMITDSGDRVAELERRVKELRGKAVACAAELTAARVSAAGRLEQGVGKLLGRLGMEGAHFGCVVSKAETLLPGGADEVAFLFSSSADGVPRPLEKIASGGEISRVMLCLKALVAQSTKLPTIIFDEIDTGVSGRIADEMGGIIAELSQSMQVINITHLPQVASKGDTHFLVYKDTRTHIRRLTQQERIEEISNMLSGSHVTDAAREHAKLLLGIK